MTTEMREHAWKRQAAVPLESHPLESRLELDRDDDRSALTVVTFVCKRCGVRGLAVISPRSNTACPDAHVPYFFHSVEQRRTLLDRMLLRMYSANKNVEDCDLVVLQRMYEDVKKGDTRETVIKRYKDAVAEPGTIWDELSIKRVLDL